ncbi:NAD(P)/FAD-dependent oxidoreductase [Streptomyces canus]|uniref:NAD(P)/FAD-dependent oxidoreductase n=1 Tax=Streptomyces canus TaxID=58343 RepID=UPI00371650E2
MPPPPHISTDLAIVGAGPAGLFATCYAGLRGLDVTVLDSLPEIGGQIAALYPEKLIHDVAGTPAVKGRDLVEALAIQAQSAAPRYLLGDAVEGLSVSRANDGQATGVSLTTAGGSAVHAGAVLLTAGVGSFSPRPLATAHDWHGRGLMYFVPEPQRLAGADVVIVGGGDSAVDWALTLEPVARSVVLVHRRDTFRAHAHTVGLLKSSRVEVITPAEITAVHGDTHVEHVEITGLAGEGARGRSATHIVAALGFSARLGPIRQWGLDIAANRHIRVDTRMATSLDRVFAAGDITDYRGKVRLIAVGFGEAATAVNNIAALLDPQAPVFPGHSTDLAPTTTATG